MGSPTDVGRAAQRDSGDTVADPHAAGSPAPWWRRRRVRLMAAATVVVLVAVAVIGTVAAGRSAAPDPAAALPTSTAKVQRTDLIVTEKYTGQLGFGEPRQVTAGREGVITSVASAGTVVQPGQPLFAVALDPTVLLTGTVPAFRAMSGSSSDGPDIAQLERFLADAGYGAGLSVDENFTAATATAVQDWETALGRPDPDGTVELGEVVFDAGALRVAQVSAQPGTRVSAGSAVLATTPTTKVVTVDVPADAATGLEAGRAARLALPDNADTTGTVASVGTQAETNPSDPSAAPTVAVVITLDDPAAAGAVDTGSVEVALERSRKEQVLAVPVTALLALAEGGYAVQVVDLSRPEGYRLVAVKAGTFADDLVEVSSEGVTEGLDVVVPK